jgi:SAM-dependent methyltransferase
VIFENQAGFCEQLRAPVDGDMVRSWFEDPKAVLHYARATLSVGLWRSEQIIFEAVFERGDRILDVGCGAGRIAVGLRDLGFTRVEGVDYALAMVETARDVARDRRLEIEFTHCDATTLCFPAESFDGLVFGFNGLMQIPGRSNRRKALAELYRVARAGARLVFTTHDRNMAGQGGRPAWGDVEASVRKPESASAAALEVGDRIGVLPEGRVFMHWPDRSEVIEDLRATRWLLVEDFLRSSVANEPREVRDFSDECRFWVCRKEPETSADTSHRDYSLVSDSVCSNMK